MWKWTKRTVILTVLIGTLMLGRYSNVFLSNAVDVWEGDTIVKLGPPSNRLRLSMLSTNDLSVVEIDTYLSNVSKIIESLPKNLPGRNTLTLFNVRDVRWFDDYAKVEFVEDKLISDLDRSGKIYRGQF